MAEADLLASMRVLSHRRVAEAEARASLAELAAVARDAPIPRLPRLDAFGLIAEVKLTSPAEGALADPASGPGALVARAQTYADAGAAAISVLTEPSRFDGSLEHLRAIADAVDAPAMRKDFLVSPYQVVEARAAGASGVLLITTMLDDADLAALLALALDLGMFALVESFDEHDVDRSRSLAEHFAEPGRVLLGLNTRDLRTLAVDDGRLVALAGRFPPGHVAVAESGIATPTDAARAARLGYGLALVGTALMRAHDPGDLIRRMTEAGRLAKDHSS